MLHRAIPRLASIALLIPSIAVLIPALSLLLPTPAAAQKGADQGGFIVRLGSDTLAVEQYARTNTTLESQLALRVPYARRVHYLAALDSAGHVARFDLTMRPLATGVGAPALGTIVFRGDTADVTVTLGDSTRQQHIAARAGAVPLSMFSHALVEQAILQAKRSGKDSVAFDWLALGSPEASASYVVRRGKDSVAVGLFGSPLFARVDRRGRLLGLDGRATTQKVVVDRVREVDVGSFATAFAKADMATGPMGQLSPRDTVHATVGPAHLLVDYGRPRKRGRQIFGNVVPWNQVWRTGANAATQFTTDAALTVGGATIPAGSYTLWTLPRPTGATLIINRQTGQWGTDYDSTQDLARVELQQERLPTSVDQFTIGVDSTASDGVLRLRWDSTGFGVPLTPIR
jgi:DUF2911 family protein